MNSEEYIKTLKELEEQDRSGKLADAFAREYHGDSLASKEQLLARAQASLGSHEGLEAVATGTNVSPLAQAFNITDKGMRRLIDLNSSSNWMNMSSSELLKAGIKGGYIREIPKDAPEWKKLEQRKQFGDFLGMLAQETNDQSHRNAVAEYENTKFTKDPFGYAQKMLNDFLFRTYSKRAKEQALLGQGYSGPSSFPTLSVLRLPSGDMATLGTDIAANTMYGAGAAGISNALAGNALRSGATLMGSDAAAGVLGGAADVLNRSFNTREGVMPYEYVTEPVVGGISNALMTPGMLRQGVSQGLSFLRGGRVGDVSRRGAMAKAADWVASKTGWDEAELARTFKELGGMPDYSSAPLSDATRKKIKKMEEIWNDGLTDSYGQNFSLFDELQLLYEQDRRLHLKRNANGELVDGVEVNPSTTQFVKTLDDHIAMLNGELETAAGKEEAPQLKRKIEYFENARDMFGSGLLNPEKALYKAQPEKYEFMNTPSFGAGSGKPVELRDAHTERDLNIMKEYVDAAKRGEAVNVINSPMADELLRLSLKYPEFGKYMENMRIVKTPDVIPTFWGEGQNRLGLPYDITFGDAVMYGGTRGRGMVPSRGLMEAAFDPKVAGWGGAARNAGASLSEAALAGIAKPAVVIAGKERFNRPDESFEAIQMKYEELKKRKPEAADAALNWKYDPSLARDKQLTAEERNLVNRYRAMIQEEAMNGR